MNLQGHADPYRTPPAALSPTDYRLLVYALVAAVTAALVFAGIALSLALARTPVVAAPPAAAPAPVAEAPACPTVAASLAVPALAKVRLDSEPDGASVTEDGVELCSSTPCEITYKGADAAPTQAHLLTVARTGFRTETVQVTPAASPILVKLRAVAPAPRPRSSPGSSTTLLF